MSDGTFNGEKLTVTKVELGLVAAIAVVVAALFVGIDVLVLVGLFLTVVMMVLLLYVVAGKLPGSGDQ